MTAADASTNKEQIADRPTLEAWVQGVALCGPGLDGWDASRPILAGTADYVPRPAQPSPPTMLSANERRRTGAAVRLALSVAQQASEMAGSPPGSIPSLFATSNGDGAVMHAILETLADGGAVSPTQFHNSVHNAAAGYWSIATSSRQPASCLAGHDATAAASLLKAMAAVRVELRPILLCVYEVPTPEPLHSLRPTYGICGVALILAPDPGPAPLARLSAAYWPMPAIPDCQTPHTAGLRAFAVGNPAAHLLRLLESLARGSTEAVHLDLLDGRLEVRVQPCSAASRSST